MIYDTIVVGAGPGGASTTFFLAQAGQRVLVLERETLPRYKPCGGAVPWVALRRFPFSFASAIEAEPARAELRYPGAPPLRFSLDNRPIAMVRRSVFDHALLTQAIDAGAEVAQGVRVTGVTECRSGVTVTATGGRTFVARHLVGADGANSTVARALGLRRRRVLGGTLEAEIAPGPPILARWRDTAMFLFGACPDGYAWIFARRDRLSVGVARFSPGRVDLRGVLVRSMAHLGIDLREVRLHGHPLPLYGGSERLHSGRCLLVGDAAGLVDPLLGEGVRYALTSGEMAARCILGGDLAAYTRHVHRHLGRRHCWAREGARVLYGFPRLSWRLGLGNPRLQRAMVEVLRGRSSARRLVCRLPLYVLESLVFPSKRGSRVSRLSQPPL